MTKRASPAGKVFNWCLEYERLSKVNAGFFEFSG